MTRILLKKLVRLGRDEDGAALIVTLALFMFMYVSCSGIFAIGQTAKNRIHLQNACDAAAYSAAVIQADTLSRIATINRAMAWTYVSMTRRQMDYIVYKWLKETCKHHEDDERAAQAYVVSRYVCKKLIHDIPPLGYGISDIKLNGGLTSYSRSTLKNAYDSDFPAWMSKKEQLPSFYSLESSGSLKPSVSLDDLASQIDVDLATIKDMGDAEEDLAKQLSDRIKRAVPKVLEANMVPMQPNSCYWYIKLHEGPSVDSQTQESSDAEVQGYLRELHNTEAEELRFVRFGIDVASSASTYDVFGKGANKWFVRDTTGAGIRRSYNKGGNILRAEWEWYATEWECFDVPYPPYHVGVPVSWASKSDCWHSHARCYCGAYGREEKDGDYITRRWIKAVSYADNNKNYDGSNIEARFRSMKDNKYVYARPLVLRDTYFGEKGTITVGLACYNENPWYRIFKNSAGVGKGILGGIFAAFNPYKHVEWSWAFSSAKAGYKFKDENLETRDYMVDWNGNQLWNLCQSDWDAVFVPVRRAVSMAKDRKWEGGTSPLHDWIMGDGWEPLGSLSVPYRVSSMPDLPGMHVGGGSSGGIQWNKVADMLYH